MKQKAVQQLFHLLARWDRRRRLQQSIVWIPRGIIAGLGVGVGLAIVSRLRPWLLTEQLAVAAGVTAAAGAVLALATVWLIRRDALTTARRFDRAFALKERVSTSLELASDRIRSPNEEITTRQLADAVARAERIDARQYLPLRLVRRDWMVLLALIGVLVVLLVMENPQSTALAQQQELQTTIDEEVANLENLREEIARNELLDDNLRENLLQALDETIDQLSQNDISREEAVATLSELAQNLNELGQRAQPEQPQQQALQQAGEQLGSMAETERAAEAMQEGALGEAAQALEDLAGSLSDMDRTAQQNLAEALSAAANQLAETNPELAQSLQEAANALREGNQEVSQQALQEAADQLRQQEGEMRLSENAGRQTMSEILQQTDDSANQVAQSGSAAALSGQSAPAPEGDTAIPIGQEGEGAQGESSQAGQSAEGELGESGGPGTGGGNEGSNTQQSSAGTAGGAGDGVSGQQDEGGFQATGQQISQDNNPDGLGLTEYEPVFAPQTIGGPDTSGMQLSGSDQPGDIVLNEGNLTEGPEGQALIGYDQVYTNYANAADEALARDYIPLNLRDVVHDYFTLINP